MFIASARSDYIVERGDSRIKTLRPLLVWRRVNGGKNRGGWCCEYTEDTACVGAWRPGAVRVPSMYRNALMPWLFGKGPCGALIGGDPMLPERVSHLHWLCYVV